MKCGSPPPWRLRSPFGMADHRSLLADCNVRENQKDSSSHPTLCSEHKTRTALSAKGRATSLWSGTEKPTRKEEDQANEKGCATVRRGNRRDEANERVVR